MFRKSIKTIFTLFVVGFSITSNAQENITIANTPKKYILGDIKVTGKVNYNPHTVVTFAGLSKGQTITVPGEEISDALKKLWKLGFFKDINFYETSVVGDTLNLELNLNELPRLNEVKVEGLKKSKSAELLKESKLVKGKIVNENLLRTTKNYILSKYKKDGYYNTKVNINTIPDSTGNKVDMLLKIDRGSRVKISEIQFNGNENLTGSKLRKSMKDTKVRSPWNPIRIFKPSRFIQEKYEGDLSKVIDKYKENGYRDARITLDTTSYDDEKNRIAIKINVEEGNKYYFGNIRYIGNTAYTNNQLSRILGIEKGEVYNGVLLEKRIADKTNPDAFDITNHYQNNGYLFSRIMPIEVKTANDTIDFEIRIMEGPIAKFNNITVSGNDRTHDHVIYRDLKTRPGENWNKAKVMETIRKLGSLQIFDAQAINPEIKNADPNTGTVDVEWQVAEKGSGQVELQGGYGGGSFIGSLGLSTNNFSLRNMFNKEAYTPFPMGDGQQMALRAQVSRYYHSYSLSFTEPWFLGTKPVQLYGSVSFSKNYLYNYNTREVNRRESFDIFSLSLGVGKQLTVPDDYFVLFNTLSFQYYNLNNYRTGLFTFGDGSSRNLTYSIELKRDNRGIDPIYPTFGSEFSISGKFTPPYSLFNGVDYKKLKDMEEYKMRTTKPTKAPNGADIPIGSFINEKGEMVSNYMDAASNQEKIDQKRFNWLEYYKVKFKGDWYTTIYDKLVLRTVTEFGFLGAYNKDRGLVPFERFYLGGDGMANYSMDGRETIQLRGYDNYALTPINDSGEQIGGTVYNKFSLELRYPITLNPTASVFALAFAEAGTASDTFSNYNPFKMQKSAGFGVRVFMPMIGLIGLDFGHGFDAGIGQPHKKGLQTHFIFGQQF